MSDDDGDGDEDECDCDCPECLAGDCADLPATLTCDSDDCEHGENSARSVDLWRLNTRLAIAKRPLGSALLALAPAPHTLLLPRLPFALASVRRSWCPKRKGQHKMATLNELRTKPYQTAFGAQKLVAKKDVTKEERAQAHAMLADVDLLEQDIAIEERVAKAQAEDRSNGRPPRAQPGAGTATDETRAAEKTAFVHYLKDWRRNKDISVSSAT